MLGILGAVLIGFGAMSFVAAHWNEMARLLRLALIFGGLFGAYGLAGLLFDRDHPAFAHAAILTGVALFGAGIMLIAQMFHISGHAEDAVLTWALGALGAGVVLRCNPALALAMLLMGLWGKQRVGDGQLRPGALALPDRLGCSRGGHAVASVDPGAAPRGRRPLHLDRHDRLLPFPRPWARRGRRHRPHHRGGRYGRSGDLGTLADVGRGGDAYGMTIAFAGLFALQFIETASLDQLILLAIIALALVIGGIWFGLRSSNSALLWLGYAGFSIEVLALCFKTVGTLLGSSLFFLSAGAIVILLAVAAYRLHSRVHPGRGSLHERDHNG